MSQVPHHGPLRRFRRRRPRLSAAVAVLTLALAGTAVGERVAGEEIRQRLTDAVRCRTGQSGSVDLDVRIGGSSALLQLARQELDLVTVAGLRPGPLLGTGPRAGSLGAGRLTLELHDVRTRAPHPIGSARVSTVIGWSALQERLGPDAGSDSAGGLLDVPGSTVTASGDRLAVDRPDGFMGQPLRVLLSVSVVPDGLTVTPEAVQIGDRQIRADLVGRLLAAGGPGADPVAPRTFRLPLPAGISLRSARVEPEGLAVSADISRSRLTSRTQARGCGRTD